jgi:hypothetical protein
MYSAARSADASSVSRGVDASNAKAFPHPQVAWIVQSIIKQVGEVERVRSQRTRAFDVRHEVFRGKGVVSVIAA